MSLLLGIPQLFTLWDGDLSFFCSFSEGVGIAGGDSGMAADIRIKEIWAEIHPRANDLLR